MMIFFGYETLTLSLGLQGTEVQQHISAVAQIWNNLSILVIPRSVYFKRIRDLKADID